MDKVRVARSVFSDKSCSGLSSYNGSKSMKRQVFEKLGKNPAFQRVYKNGRSRANKYLVMYVLKNDSEENRFGITVSKKVGNSVVRHRVTRLIRESIRLNLEQFEKGFDIVIVARNTAKERSYFDVESALLHLGRLHKIVMR